jgi:hypothetical protein
VNPVPVGQLVKVLAPVEVDHDVRIVGGSRIWGLLAGKGFVCAACARADVLSPGKLAVRHVKLDRVVAAGGRAEELGAVVGRAGVCRPVQ